MTKKEIVTTLQVTLAKKGIELSASNANTVLDTVLDTVRKLTVKDKGRQAGLCGIWYLQCQEARCEKGDKSQYQRKD